MRKLFREPLLQFLLLGAGLFALHALVAPSGAGDGTHVVITQGRIAQLAAGYALMHQRPPDRAELDGLVQDAIREEILYREAKALGLDRDDTIVRRRLRQKLEFVSEDVAALPEPSEAQLQAYLQAHPGQFRVEAAYTFTQVYFEPQRRGDKLSADVANALASLQRAGSGADPSTLGDGLLVPKHFDGIAAGELSRLFGARFETALAKLPAGRWQGPVASSYGVHLVRLERRDDARRPRFADIRADVRQAWLEDQRRRANERFYADLRSRYVVTIEPAPAPKPRSPALAAELRP